MRIGFVALGRMGSAMARRLLEGGLDVTVFNRTAAKSDALAAAGAKVAKDLAALCGKRDLVITMLPSDAALLEVALGEGGLAETMAAGTIHMACGTHGVAAIEKVNGGHGRAGQRFVAAPVLGRPELAAAGHLTIVPAGPAKIISELQDILERLGNVISGAGEDPAAATAVKIAHNFVLGCAIEAMGEGMALVRKHGVDAALFHDVLTRGLFACKAYEIYGGIIARQDWDNVGASVVVGLKDADLALEAGARAGVPLPSGQVWRDHLAAAWDKGEGARDWSVMALEQFRESGLER